MILEFSEQREHISKALVVAQGAMGEVIKNAANPHLGNKYADLAAVMAAVTPAYKAAGIAVLQSPTVAFEGSSALVTVETLLLHESGQWARNLLSLKPSKSDPQGIGSAITYARRYALLALAGVAPEDDDGTKASGPVDKEQDAVDPNRPLLESQKRTIGSLLDSAKKTVAWHDIATKLACDKVSQGRTDGTSATCVDELRFAEANQFMQRIRKVIKDGVAIPQPVAHTKDQQASIPSAGGLPANEPSV